MPAALRLSLVDLAFPAVVAVDLLPAVVVVDLVLPAIVVVDLALPAIVVVALPAVVAVDLTSYSPVPSKQGEQTEQNRQIAAIIRAGHKLGRDPMMHVTCVIPPWRTPGNDSTNDNPPANATITTTPAAGTKARQRQLVHDDNRVKHNGNGTHWHKAASNAVAHKPTSWPATATTTDNNNTADDAADDGGDATTQQTAAAT
ncbi:hypothetical protein EDB89DRAFT_1912480 [Lactarius sanguifluus]|nr:hypothetical protein EDB89DRAFT_1912480 [Lactarius sanguifluus]